MAQVPDFNPVDFQPPDFAVPPTIPSTVRPYAFQFDRNGSPIYWWIDTATGLPGTYSDGTPLNPR